MSAIYEEGDAEIDVPEPIKVLIALFDGMDIMDAVGPLETFSHAYHDKGKKDSKAFRVIFAGKTEHINTNQGTPLRAHITYDEAMKRLSEIDVLVIPGGADVEPIIKAKDQPLALIRAFADLQKKNPARERSLMSVCTGSLILADTGILSGLCATTHPDAYTKLEIICGNASQRDLSDRTDVMEERYVVNNLRFELGENPEDNPYVMSKHQLKEQRRRRSSAAGISPIEERPNAARRPSAARKGSISLKMSNMRRESVLKRANLRLGGLRVITTGGVTSGIDGALYLIGALVSDDAAEEAARIMCHKWQKGVVVDGTDV